jgi:(R,R)-butanediol dehydrogenase / meso-butanediol dehydrogenase / diacetyl reductase
MDRLGGFSEWIVIAASVCVPVPAAVPSLHAVLGEPLGNGLHFVRRARLHAGQRVAVLGAGQIGLSIIYWARRLGAARIVVSEPATPRAQLARELGADAVLDPQQHENISGAITDALGGRPEIVFEATGRPAVMHDAIHLVGPGGGAVAICGITLDEITIRPTALILKETDLIFPLGTVREEVEEAVAALARGAVPAERFISHRIAQTAIPVMLRDLGRPTDQIKVVVEYDV